MFVAFFVIVMFAPTLRMRFSYSPDVAFAIQIWLFVVAPTMFVVTLNVVAVRLVTENVLEVTTFAMMLPAPSVETLLP